MKPILRLMLGCFVLMLCASSCRYSAHDKSYTYSDEWKIDYPSFLRKSTHVYPGSELQLANGYRDTYIFVREVVTTMNREEVADSLRKALFETLEDPRVESDSSYFLNGSTFKVMEITGLLNDKRMYYIMAFIQSDDQLFQFTGWMFNHKRDLWEEDYKRMLHSFERLHAHKVSY
jgi:hypothetical protein